MDGIFLIVLAGFAGLSAALLKLCLMLAPQASAQSPNSTGDHAPTGAPLSSLGATDRGQ